MNKPQRDVLVKALQSLSDQAREISLVVRTGASAAQVEEPIRKLEELAGKIHDALENHLGAATLLTAIAEPPPPAASAGPSEKKDTSLLREKLRVSGSYGR